jgi:uncharacterized protein
MTDHDLQRLRDDVAAAALVVAPSWPLSTTIAVNPLAGLEHLPFDEALERAAALFGTRGHLTLGEFRAAMADGRLGEPALRRALRRAVPGLADAPAVTVGIRSIPAEDVLLADLVIGPQACEPARRVRTVAEQVDLVCGTDLLSQVDQEAAEHCLQRAAAGDRDPTAAEPGDRALVLHAALEALEVPPGERGAYLEAHVAAQPGWAAHLRWRDAQDGGDALLEHLSIRVAAEARLVAGIASHRVLPAPAEPGAVASPDRTTTVADHLGAGADDHAGITATLALLPEHRRELVWLDAYERTAHDPLLAGIARASTDEPAPAGDLVAHVVCCIDVRSQALRRNLEARGGYRTYGYAGFFGLPVRIDPVTGGAGSDQCPVLLRPSAVVAEVAADDRLDEVTRLVERRRMAAAGADAWRAAKYHPVAPLALAEAAGWLAGAVAAARTGAPVITAWLTDHLPGAGRPDCVEHDRGHLPVEQQAALVAAIWGLGMADEPAPLVVLCGHGSRSDNNPMESGLACGACGGNPGGANARLAAAMANDPVVRAHLSEHGVDIPTSTWFLAGEHDTATDRVTLFGLDGVPPSHAEAVTRLTDDLAAAGEGAALDRALTLPGAEPPASRSRARTLARVRRRGRDWAEPVTELGLAGNMAFVVGPRSLTAHLDLGRRVFLHSYDAGADTDGATLGGILTAPLVVAQWINAQYYFSTTDPEQFGAGSKAVHNVVGDIGVLSGPGGDLRRGLARQSVRAGTTLLHEPVRLLAVVQGRLDHVDATIAGSTTLQQLIGNGWISLVARQHAGEPWRQRAVEGWFDRLLDDRGDEEGRLQPSLLG